MNSKRLTCHAICVFLSLVCSLLFTAASSAAIVTYNGSNNIDVASSWTPADRPDAAGDVGTIAVGGLMTSSQSWAALGGTIINQTAGVLDFDGQSMNFRGDAVYNMSGGSMTDMNVWIVNGGTEVVKLVYNMSGGSVDAATINSVNSGTLNMLAGDGTVVVGTNAGSSGMMDFQTGWTGSFTIGDYDEATWKDLFDATGLGGVFATFNGSSLTSSGFDAAFQLTIDETTLSLLPVVTIPEPTTLTLAAFGLVGLCFTRRRRKVCD